MKSRGIDMGTAKLRMRVLASSAVTGSWNVSRISPKGSSRARLRGAPISTRRGDVPAGPRLAAQPHSHRCRCPRSRLPRGRVRPVDPPRRQAASGSVAHGGLVALPTPRRSGANTCRAVAGSRADRRTDGSPPTRARTSPAFPRPARPDYANAVGEHDLSPRPTATGGAGSGPVSHVCLSAVVQTCSPHPNRSGVEISTPCSGSSPRQGSWGGAPMGM